LPSCGQLKKKEKSKRKNYTKKVKEKERRTENIKNNYQEKRKRNKNLISPEASSWKGP